MPDPSLLAHGLGGRTDLPLDPLLASLGAAAAVAATFLVVGVLWPGQRLAGQPTGRALPRLTRVVDAPVLTATARTLALGGSTLVVAVAFLGPRETRLNLAPYALYVAFWVGLPILSVLVGPVWARVNPLRTLHAGVCRLAGLPPHAGLVELPPGVGMWPAAGWLLVFVWLELVYPDRAEPSVVGLFLVTYAAVTLVLALGYGNRWFAAGDGFEVYSRLLGALSPLGRRADGMLAWRNPLTGLTGIPSRPGLAAAVVVLIGSTGFDGLTRTRTWQDAVAPDAVGPGTVGLLAMVGAVGALYVAALRLGTGHAGTGTAAGTAYGATPAGDFAHSLVPIALGYTLAHYFSFFLFEGQVALALASDPFGLGWDLLGTAGRRVDYLLVGPAMIATVQIAAIVLGHVCGVVAAHDRALSRYGPAAARRSQYPLAVVMTGITLCGTLLLVAA